ncbi:hypothetical protein MASR1M32_04420 [Rhodobacter sp.]
MLNIFADALLVAIRMEPLGPRPVNYRPRPDSEEKAKVRWFALSGLQR